MRLEDPTAGGEREGSKEPREAAWERGGGALGALLEGEADAAARARSLAARLGALDAANVGGLLRAAADGGGAPLAGALDAALGAAAALRERLRRCEDVARPAADAVHARSDAARADLSARALLRELRALGEWLDAPELREPEAAAELPLASPEGRARALAAADALCAALEAEARAPPHLRRLAAVAERLRRLKRARDQVAAALARHVNNVLVHVGNEGGARPHAELLPLAPLVRALRRLDPAAAEALARVYTGWRARAIEREARAACDAARAALPPHAPPAAADGALDEALAALEALCDAEQRFCERFFLDADAEPDADDAAARARAALSRRYAAALFASLEPALAQLTQHVERHDQYGAFRVYACIGRRVLGEGADGEARWARAALAGAAVAAKRQADRAVRARAARAREAGARAAVDEFEELSGACESIFGGGRRRADAERWYLEVGAAAAEAVGRADGGALRLRGSHRLHAALSALRAPALEGLRRECRARYERALREYVVRALGRPLERVTAFFERVAEAVAAGCPEAEVRYRAATSKAEARKALAAHSAADVRRALAALRARVIRHVGDDGLLQVVWRALQEELLAQVAALEARLAACYPGAGLRLPLTAQDVLDAFSDIAADR